MPANFVTWIQNLGNLAGSALTWRSKVQSFINKSPELLSTVVVAGGTSTSNFYLAWSPYAVPQYAIVFEGTNMWFTSDGGSSWQNPTLTNWQTGDIREYLKSSLPSGWLWCDGSAQSRTTYSGLYTALASGAGYSITCFATLTTWVSGSQITASFNAPISGVSVGDFLNISWFSGSAFSRLAVQVTAASTTSVTVSGGSGDSFPNTVGLALFLTYSSGKFFVPDRRGLMPLGKDNMGGTSANRVTSSLADTTAHMGGSETHTLTTAELPAHNHNLQINSGGAGPNTYVNANALAGSLAVNSTFIQNAGSGNAHNNMPPYFTTQYIIKT